MAHVLATSASARFVSGTRSRARTIARDVAFVIAGSLLIAGTAQISVKLPFTPVPITGQTFGVLLVGASLGSLLGLLSAGLYVIEGGIGAPFFAGGAHGWSVITGSNGGYLIGFMFAALVAGFLAERAWDRQFRTATSAFLTGEIMFYAFGLPWLSHSLHLGLEKTLEDGLYPFVIGDILKVYLAAAVLPLAWRFVKKDDAS